MIRWLNKWTRKLHRWGAVITLIPILLVITTGILLQVKKQFSWIQPPTMAGQAESIDLSFADILRISTTEPAASIEIWDDIDRLDVRPDKGIVKVRSTNRWELQIDLQTGEILHSAYRRSDFIESLHDGSWFDDAAKLWVFLPNGLVLLGLWCTGTYLWFLPIIWKRRNRRQRAARERQKGNSE